MDYRPPMPETAPRHTSAPTVTLLLSDPRRARASGDGPVTLRYQAADVDGLPLYVIDGRSSVEQTRVVAVSPPFVEDPAGIAARSKQASFAQRVAMVAAGERPAAEGYEAEDPDAAAIALSFGLYVCRLRVRLAGDAFATTSIVAAVDRAAAETVVRTLLLPLGSLDCDIAFGRALGYAEADIAAFCLRMTRLVRPALDPQAELDGALARAA